MCSWWWLSRNPRVAQLCPSQLTLGASSHSSWTTIDESCSKKALLSDAGSKLETSEQSSTTTAAVGNEEDDL
jgi:hypothetical protein